MFHAFARVSERTAVKNWRWIFWWNYGKRWEWDVEKSTVLPIHTLTHFLLFAVDESLSWFALLVMSLNNSCRCSWNIVVQWACCHVGLHTNLSQQACSLCPEICMQLTPSPLEQCGSCTIVVILNWIAFKLCKQNIVFAIIGILSLHAVGVCCMTNIVHIYTSILLTFNKQMIKMNHN